MSNRTYVVPEPMTFSEVSLRVYGDSTLGDLIRRANPVANVFVQASSDKNIPAETFLYIPEYTYDAPKLDVRKDPDEVTVKVNGEDLQRWESLKISHSLTMMSTFEASVPFDGDTQGIQNRFRPFSYDLVEIYIGNELQFYGTLIGVAPKIDDKSMKINLEAYAKPGVLSDCTAPASEDGWEFYDRKIEEIMRTVMEPFSIRLVSDEDTGPARVQENLSQDQKIMEFFIQMAQLSNMVITNTADGALKLYTPIKDGEPVARLKAGDSPLLEVVPTFNPRMYYSSINALAPTLLGFPDGGNTPEKNPFLQNVFRPLTFTAKVEDDALVQKAAQSKISRMFANACNYQITVAGWRDSKGALWKPNTMLSLEYPQAMIYKEYKFLISKVALNVYEDKRIAVLTLALPGSYSGDVPARLPWVV